MLAHQPVSVVVAGLAFVRPDVTTKLKPKAWDMLGQAILLQDAGMDLAAASAIRRLEDRLGVHDAHRRALVSGVEAELQANRRRAAAGVQMERRRARDLAAPLNPAPIAHEVLAKMAEARKAEETAKILKASDPRKNRAEIKKLETKAKLARKSANELQGKAANEHWSFMAGKESESLAKGRDELVEEVETEIAEWVRDEDGCLVRDHSSQVGILRTEKARVRKMISRDGLEHMLNLGHLTNRQYGAGLSYRQSFTVRADDMQPARIGDSTGGSGSGADVKAFARAKKAVFAKDCETAVRIRCTKHASAAQMLQWVAGMGRSMRDFGAGGRAYERNRKALAAALDVVIDISSEIRRKGAA